MKKIIIFYIICILVFRLLWVPSNAITYFYEEPKNSLDIAYIGSSNAYAHFNTVLAYNKYGFTTGMFSADGQPFVLTKYCIKEIQKYQKPKLYIIDLAKATDLVDSVIDGDIRKTVDIMKLSNNRIDAINEVLSYKSNIVEKDYINYYFSFLLYHNKWKQISKENIFKFIKNTDLYKGYCFSGWTSRIVTQDKYTWNESEMDIEPETEEVLMNLINYIKSNNLNVLFVIPSRYFEEETNKKLNKVIHILQENNLNVINFNTLKDFNDIDFSHDFYNAEHINVYGATKYTLYFSKYLKEKYDLNDHRNDKNYSSWDKEYERFKTNYKNKMNQDIEDLIY